MIALECAAGLHQTKAVADPAPSTQALVAAADQAMAAGDRQRAAELLARAARDKPELDILLRLASVQRALGDYGAASDTAAAAVKLAPGDFIALLMLATMRDAIGAEHRAGRTYRAALECVPDDSSLPPPVRKQLDWARRRVAADAQWQRSVATLDFSEFEGEERGRLEGLRQSVLTNSAAAQQAPTQFLIPGLRSLEFFEPADFPGVPEIERAMETVLEEFLALTDAKAPQLAPYLSGLDSSQPDPEVIGKWTMIPLIRGGTVVEDYASLCPETMRLFEALDAPRIALIAPSLYFSILEPHSRIEPHTGILNARLIVHWPLIVPGNCGFRVGSEARDWVPGRALVFDDMIEHEAWNDSDRIRVVLISDVWRPDLSKGERRAITQMMDRKLVAD